MIELIHDRIHLFEFGRGLVEQVAPTLTWGSMSTLILGITSAYHEPSAALLQDGEAFRRIEAMELILGLEEYGSFTPDCTPPTARPRLQP